MEAAGLATESGQVQHPQSYSSGCSRKNYILSTCVRCHGLTYITGAKTRASTKRKDGAASASTQQRLLRFKYSHSLDVCRCHPPIYHRGPDKSVHGRRASLVLCDKSAGGSNTSRENASTCRKQPLLCQNGRCPVRSLYRCCHLAAHDISAGGTLHTSREWKIHVKYS